MNSTTTTSSKDVTKAKSAPDTTPGVISGSCTLKKVRTGPAPKTGRGAQKRAVKAHQRCRDGDDDERNAQRRMCQDHPA
jgi:hypothetical protein